MTCSMTAFTRQQSKHNWGILVWELRSVNHRYLEASVSLPESLRNLEPQVRELLRNALHRGKIQAQLRFTSNPETDSAFEFQINESIIYQIQQAHQKIAATMPDSAPLNTLELLKWPGVIQEPEKEIKVIEEHALTLFQKSLEILIKHRHREGSELKKLIGQRLESISNIVAEIRLAMPEILARQKERMLAHFAEVKLEVEPSRLEQEIVLIAQKADVNEEIDRLDIHVKEVARTLSQNGPVGRRLDFLMQELNREANTVCSKAVVSETTLCAVELKVQIEQMREQIQNIE